MSLLGTGHLHVGDGLPQCLLGNEGVQVQHGGQTAVQADELLLVGPEVDYGGERERERREKKTGSE